MNQINETSTKRNIVLLDEAESTNTEALKLAREGASSGTVVIAKKQTKGRGRHGRVWDSPEGNLHMSIIMRPDPAVAEDSAQLSFVIAVACHDALDEAGVPSIQFKWPNDLLIKGRKFGGILLEKAGEVVVIGVGINIHHFPSDVMFPATCLEAEGFKMPPHELAHLILPDFERRYQEWHGRGFEEIRELWLQHISHKGEKISVKLPDKTLEGKFNGIDKNGALLLDVGGKVEKILAGDVFF